MGWGGGSCIPNTSRTTKFPYLSIYVYVNYTAPIQNNENNTHTHTHTQAHNKYMKWRMHAA